MTQNNTPPITTWGVRIAGSSAALIGSYWFMVWLMGWAAQRSASGAVIMKTNMALCLILAGVALLLLAPTAATRLRRAVGAVLAALVLLIALLTLSEHVLDLNLGIDQLLATETPGAAATASPNRMGLPGSLCLTLLGMGFLLLAGERRAAAPYFGLAVYLVVLVPIVGYLYRIEELFSHPRLTWIAWPSVVALSLLGLGLILAQPQTGPVALLRQAGPGSILLRQRLPLVLLVPLVLGYLFLQGEQHGWYNHADGYGLLVLSLMVILSLLTWRSALYLNRLALAEAEAHQAVRASESRLRHSLDEKEVLLKEIHHRVKNNLQIISSLVDLQAAALDNPALREVFADVRDRVRSMALAHEKLYQSANLVHVDFAEYTRGLVNYLWRAHGSLVTHLQLKLDLQPVLLSVETAVPSGLILNELVTNVLKHAFPGRSEGQVTIVLRKNPDGQVCLRVSDNGVGLPARLDWRQARSLGLRLVQMLTRQLNGVLEVIPGAGVEFVLTIPLPS